MVVDFGTFVQRSHDLENTLTSIESVLDIESLIDRAKELEIKVADPTLWDDAQLAQGTVSELSRINSDLSRLESLKSQLAEIPLLVDLVQEESESEQSALAASLTSQLEEIEKVLDEWETKVLLSGEYDQREAYLTVRSGAGGVDAADWAQMLLRMYLRWAESHNYSYEVLDISYAEEAGIKSATVMLKFPYAFGTLSVEVGTHRLVRISPFDNQSRRQTSFAEIEVLPVVESADHIDINENELKIDVYRSSGPGGQSVNTTDSAVRITHIPTGIVVTCQNEKSQLQNKASALKVLSAKLLERNRQEEQEHLDSLKKEGGTSWGNQMRSYVLHPYQMVKDLRTEYEVNNPSLVLDGELDGFINAAIKAKAKISHISR